MTTAVDSQDVSDFARANLPSNPRNSKVFTIPHYMLEPDVSFKYGHQIRIWRTKLIQLYSTDVRRICALMEWTDLQTGLTLGLMWSYSVHQKEAWKPIKYILYSHFPGEQPCQDLNDVYRSTTAEINWVIKRLEMKYQRKTKPAVMKPLEPVEGFPR